MHTLAIAFNVLFLVCGLSVAIAATNPPRMRSDLMAFIFGVFLVMGSAATLVVLNG